MTHVQEIVLASGNAGKLRELSEMFVGTTLRIRSLQEFGAIAEPDEPFDTFEANAVHKARYYHRTLRLGSTQAVLADDSGLCVDALDGAPGVHSARFAGDPRSDKRNNAKLLKCLEPMVDFEQRRAYFVCVLALVLGEIERCYRGEVCGHIATSIQGERGFGYDALFIPRGYVQTFGELDDSVKRTISHRSQALRQLLADAPAW